MFSVNRLLTILACDATAAGGLAVGIFGGCNVPMANRQRHPAADAAVTAADGGRMQVQRTRLALVLDPDTTRRQGLMAMLEALGFAVLGEADAEAALKTCWRLLPRLVIVHAEAAGQPGAAGRKAACGADAAALVARFLMLPKAGERAVIGCLSRHDASAGVRMLLAGARDCLVCPVDADTLRQRLLLAGVLDGEDDAAPKDAERTQ